MPPPTAAPCSAAITGLFIVKIRFEHRPAGSCQAASGPVHGVAELVGHADRVAVAGFGTVQGDRGDPVRDGVGDLGIVGHAPTLGATGRMSIAWAAGWRTGRRGVLGELLILLAGMCLINNLELNK